EPRAGDRGHGVPSRSFPPRLPFRDGVRGRAAAGRSCRVLGGRRTASSIRGPHRALEAIASARWLDLLPAVDVPALIDHELTAAPLGIFDELQSRFRGRTEKLGR